MYKLKAGIESFTVVDGPYAGRKYARGRTYADIPPQEIGRFEKIKEASLEPLSSAVEDKPAKADKQKATPGVASENGEVK